MELKVDSKNKLRFWSVTSVVAVILFSFLGIFHAETVLAAGFAGGTGSVGDPYQISTCVQLQEMQNYRSSFFVLTGDIDCSATSGWNGGAGFVPVGSSYSVPFSGGFDGGNYTISDLYINLPATDNVGLFGYVMSSQNNYIKDLKLSNVTIIGKPMSVH
ncbi:hypothetical protein A2480_01230 [Candidatus Uhrbacteria bacterium RIFOXYC2_FULL_47_19]|uniref:Uncharacterized protein n=1 Tax=Candidatus Uhrbacteria bacterium RIFOXYC2_FULL_47_19 TaxID=1802424 RepID=A0A1F7WFI9_9BACT|nr:MAG: hypothetical protein A2480_01230 [Candidatus Uhrbacteria bacterium RIFOXYC2_FULL_47_19]HCC22403.1 hypothetical protein [Candidatus Uhrbacteria bacterium]